MKLTKYDKNNILGWTEEEFDGIIYDFMQVNILSSNPQSSVINAKYQQICDDVRNRRMGLTKDYFKQEEIKRLKNKLKELEE